MALLGYARVSTSHQKLTTQISELKVAGVRALLQIVGGDKLIIPFC